MPQAIPAAAAAFANWAFAATGIAYGGTLHAVVTAAFYYGAQAALYATVTVGLNSIAQAQIPDVETQKQTRKQTRPLRYRAIGGPSRMSGPFMLRESKGNRLALVIACCDDRLASVDRLYLNDDIVTLSGGYVEGLAGERYGTGDLIRMEYRLGLPTETHYSFLTADFGTYWPTTARGDGIASIGLLAQHRSVESFARHFPNGIPEPSMVGAPVCYDWRDPAQDREDESTWEVSWNPVVWLVHVEWTRHGRSWTRSIQPVLDALTAEADYCDEAVDGEARYRVAGNYPVNLTPGAVRSNLLASMDGWLSVTGRGHLALKSGRYVAPTFTLTAEHITGYSWKAFQVAEEAVNELVVSYVSSEHDYSEIEAGTYAKAEPNPLGKSESLQLPWVPSAKQAMRLAARKMTRLDAERRGQIRSTVFGLNGLGERYIRIQNPELASMADVVVEVMNVEFDPARAEVIFDVILADTDIDVPGTAPVVPAPPDRPAPQPGYQQAPERPIWKDIDQPLQADTDELQIPVEYNVRLASGEMVTIPTAVIPVAGSDNYAVFYREDEGVTAVARAASDPYFETGSRIFLGWQATPDGGGDYPTVTPPPPGSGGLGDSPAYDPPA
jgi:hypothetical protein